MLRRAYMLFKLKPWLWNVVAGNLPMDYDLETLRKIILMNLIIILGGVFLAILGLIGFAQKDYLLGAIDFALLSFLVFLFVYLKKHKKHNVVGLIGTIAAGAFFLLLIGYGGVSRTAYVWSFTYPLISLFLMGKRLGTCLSLPLLGIACLIFYLGARVDYLPSYRTDLVIRFIPAYITIYLFAYAMEFVREIAQRKLEQKNIELKNAVLELEEKTVQLTESNTRMQAEVIERQRVEKELRQKENFLDDVIESIQDGISVLDPNLTIRHTNSVMRKWYANNVPLVGRKCYACYQNLNQPCNPCPSLRCLQSGITERNIVPGLPGNDVEWVELFSYPIKEKEMGKIAGVVEFARNITERMRTENALREREERLQAILAASPDPIVMYDTGGRPQYLNPAFTEVFGWTLDHLQGRRIPFIPEDQQSITEAAVRDLYRSRSTSRFETRRTTRDGRTLDILFSAAVVGGPEDEPAGMVVNLTDISHIKGLQAQYEHAQRMEAIGTLAGGIAHDFNNLLMGIQGRASLMGADSGNDHSRREHIDAIEEYVKSASNLTKQLLGFARGGKYEVKAIDLNDLVADSAAMFGRTRKQIRIHTKTTPAPLVVDVDWRQIEQVLLNIFVNAWQAMPDGGDLYLETSLVILDEAACEPHRTAAGRYAKIAVTDTGVGIDDAVRQRIFDPFFTTKEKGRGTGLGLASAYGIVKNHGGMITVFSELGHGTTFNVHLPASTRAVHPKAAPQEKMIRGSETILLVDDEEMIIDVSRAMLKTLGYRIVVARNGQQAVEAVQRMGGDIDLVILDLIMPGMGGGTVFDRIRTMHSAMPVMLSSGYAIDGHAAEIMDRGCNGFIQKPFNLSELSHKVRKVLDVQSRS